MARSEGRNEDASESRDEAFVGRDIGKYKLARVIGKGGMGVVYEAQNTAIGKRVAIKLVLADLAKNKDAVLRFQREAQAASAVESAHIVDIFDAGVSDDGVPYIVMELLRGEDLGHRIKRLGRLELGDALNVTMQILRGLGRAHTAGIVHRDLKPDNIFLVDRDDDSTFVKILDFGISKVARPGETPVQTLTKEGTVLGTPFYMAPEQAQGFADIDGRADLWSVGAIVYECLTGRAPHTGSSYEQVIVNICTKDADDVRMHNPAVPEPVARAIAKALARERPDRYAKAREFLDALVTASGGVISVSPRSSDEPGAPTPSGATSGVVSSPSGAKLTAAAFDETVELMKSGSPSRVGWTTNGGAATRRDRRRVLFVALGALALGVLATILFVLRKPGDLAVHTDDAPLANGSGSPGPREVTVKLHANVQGARFTVDGRQIAGGLLRGAKGDKKKVVVEADGYAPLETIVALDTDLESLELQLGPRGASPEGSGSAQPVVTPLEPATKSSGKAAGKPSAGPSSKPSAVSSAVPIATPTAAPTVAPAPTPTLTIKRD
jgi:serine/threonine protein kinase